MRVQRDHSHGTAGVSRDHPRRRVVDPGETGAFDVSADYFGSRRWCYRLRRTYKVKVPDAIIASSALVAGVELLTYDRQLQNVLVDEMAAQTTKTD